MSELAEPFDSFEAPVSPDEALMVAVDGFEGPLDLLLSLARSQKVDIAKISVLKLADQYLEFVESARGRNLELSADYLVMAAWLAFLKSRMILPQPVGEDGEPTPDEMAARLRWRLQRLEAMRRSATRLMGRERLGRDVFARGMPEPVKVVKLRAYSDTLYDLLTAYATERVRKLGGKNYQPKHAPRPPDRRGASAPERMLGRIADWSALTRLLPLDWSHGPRRRSALASTLLACLELARDGRVEIRQLRPFDEVYVKDRVPAQGAPS